MNAYFREINIFTPLLHEPTFRAGLRASLHRAHGAFGATVLLVCAIGAMYVRDPRTLLSGQGGGDGDPQSAGWAWFARVEGARRSLLAPPTIYDLQIRVVSCLQVE